MRNEMTLLSHLAWEQTHDLSGFSQGALFPILCPREAGALNELSKRFQQKVQLVAHPVGIGRQLLRRLRPASSPETARSPFREAGL